MKKQTSPEQRQRFYEAHQAGQTYETIAAETGVSVECVRYWCRRQRDGGDSQSRYHREGGGLLSRFDPLVRYGILRLRLNHPRWGPSRIRYHLSQRAATRKLALPSVAEIGRYLHQWPRFRRPLKRRPTVRVGPDEPTEVHQQWQIDFKTDLQLADGSRLVLHTIRDPVGEACLDLRLYLTTVVDQRVSRVPLDQVRQSLRHCFSLWQTLPDEVQTDGECTLVTSGEDAFPSLFTLWLAGLGIRHRVIRSGRPTDQAEVERSHRTVNDYAIVGNEDCSLAELQAIVDTARLELLWHLPSRAEGCHGQPPAIAHPDLLEPRHPFRPEHELAHFDLNRVDAFLTTFVWSRKVGKTGQICLGGHHVYYSVGRAFAQQVVTIQFDPSDRHFVFFHPDDPALVIQRRPARYLSLADLTGLVPWPTQLPPQQLPLPLCFDQEVSF